jgi:hypothetical protein
MNRSHPDIANFFIAGINYKKSDAAVRGQFSINNDQYLQVISSAAKVLILKNFLFYLPATEQRYTDSAEDAAALM